EEGGHDYPLGFVRWTEQRNFEAFLDALEAGLLDLEPLRTHEFPIESAEQAYDLIGSGEPCLGVLLRFPMADLAASEDRAVALPQPNAVPAVPASERGVVNFVGAGSYAGAVLVPAFRATEAVLNRIGSANGLSAVHNGRKFGFRGAGSDTAELIADPAADC